MKFLHYLKYKINYLKLYWRYLVFILALLFLPHFVFAGTNTYNFDEVSDVSIPLSGWPALGYPAYDRFPYGYATSTFYNTNSSPNSLNTSYHSVMASTTNPQIFSFWFYGDDDSDTKQSFYFRNGDDTSWTYQWNISQLSSKYRVKACWQPYGIGCNDGQPTNAIVADNISREAWHKFQININSTSLDLYIDNVLASSSIPLSTNFASTTDIYLYSSGSWNYGFWFDDMAITDSLTYQNTEEDYNSINLTTPANGDTLSDITTGYFFSGNYHQASSSQQTRISVDYNRVGSSTVYSLLDISDDPYYFYIHKAQPLSDGSYTATAYLYAYADLCYVDGAWVYEQDCYRLDLASSTSVFTINSTSTDYWNSGTFTDVSTTTLRNMVCTADEWASGNWWDKIQCNVLYAILRTAYSLRDFASSAFSYLVGQLKLVFPFSLFTGVYDSWQASSASLPSDMSFVSDVVDSNGNITLTMPSEWSATSTVIFGSSLYSQNENTNDWFALIEAASTYFMWFLFIMFCVAIGYRAYGDVIAVKKENR